MILYLRLQDLGSAKMGTDDGRMSGTAVVDLNTKVYGTDNIFVVDASIFPGMSTGNPSAMIVVVAEHAADKILSLPIPAPGGFNDQCGGRSWTGGMTCKAPLKCRKWNDNLSTVCTHKLNDVDRIY
jgi:cellobiose dehydrogenase (acceptor)